MKRIYFVIAVVAMLFSSCYKEDPIKTEIGTQKHIIEDSSDPGLHARYEFFNNTGVKVLFEYDDADFMWDVAAISNNILVNNSGAGMLQQSMEYLKKILFDNYSNDFMKNYFPINILLADSINHSLYLTPYYTDRSFATGRSYLAVGLIRSDTLGGIMQNPVLLNDFKGAVNGRVWAYSIIANNLISIPDSYYEVSGDYYDTSFSGEEGKDDDGYIQSYGFWGYNYERTANTYMSPSIEMDFYDFISRITSHSKEEMDAMMKPYPKLQLKYNILCDAIKEATGIDLQSIGNAKIK